MSSNDNRIPGFHGDGDSSIELHHDDPVVWTRKSTAWAVALIVIGVAASIAGYILLLNNA